jgi:hypothetical protein
VKQAVDPSELEYYQNVVLQQREMIKKLERQLSYAQSENTKLRDVIARVQDHAMVVRDRVSREPALYSASEVSDSESEEGADVYEEEPSYTYNRKTSDSNKRVRVESSSDDPQCKVIASEYCLEATTLVKWEDEWFATAKSFESRSNIKKVSNMYEKEKAQKACFLIERDELKQLKAINPQIPRFVRYVYLYSMDFVRFAQTH